MTPLIAVGLVLLIVALPLSLAAAGDGVLPGDVAIARAVQQTDLPGASRLAQALNWAGQAFPAVVALCLLVAAGLALAGRRAEALLMVAAAALRALSTPIKALFGSPRPTADLVQVIEQADGLGFPSGHAFGATLFYGALFAIAPAIVGRRAIVVALRVAAVVMIVATGLARVRTGAHWPSDVLGGYLWGGAALLFLLAAYHAGRR